MSLLTILLLLILLILTFDHYSQNKEKYTDAIDFRTQQYKNNELQLESTKKAIQQNKRINMDTDTKTIQNNILMNDKICKTAKFYDYDNIDENSKSYNKGLIIKPNVIEGIPKFGTQFEIIGNDEIYSKCQPNQSIDITRKCDNLRQQCFDIDGNNIAFDFGETINDDNGNEMCKYSECANQCSVQQRYCYTSNNTDGFVREKIFMDECIHPIVNDCVLLSDNEFLEHNITDLCPYKTYYHVFDSNGTNDGRKLHFYDKSVEIMQDNTTYKCLYDVKKEHTTNTFDSLDDLFNQCSITNFQSNLQCFSNIENQRFVLNTEYPYDQINCRYHTNEICYFPMTDNNSNILCEYNSFNDATKECVLPITCSKTVYAPYSEEHVGDIKSDTYDKITINGRFQEDTVDGKKHIYCVYDDTQTTLNASTESFISEQQYLDNISCSNVRCGKGVINNLPNGQVQCVFHNCPSDALIYANNKLSKSKSRLTKLKASQKVTQDKINEFKNIQKSVDKDTTYIKNQQYLLNNQEEQLTDKAIRTSSKLDTFKSIDTTLRRKISNTNKEIDKLRNIIGKPPIIEGFSMEDNLQASVAIAETAIQERNTQADLEREEQQQIERIQQTESSNEQTRINSENEAIKKNRIQEQELNNELNTSTQQLRDLGLSHDDQANIENISINQYNERDATINKIEKLKYELVASKKKHKALLDAEKEMTNHRNTDPKYNMLKLSNMLTAIKNDNNILKNKFENLTECNKNLSPKDFLECVIKDLEDTNIRMKEVEKEKNVAVQAKNKAETAAVKAKSEATAAIDRANLEAKSAIKAKLEADKAKVAADKAKANADKAVADKADVAKAIADKAVADKVTTAKVAADKAVADKAIADKAVADKVVADKVVADKVVEIQKLTELANEEERLVAIEKERVAREESMFSEDTKSNPTGVEYIPNINCEVSPWSPWGDCSESCGGGRQTKTRSVTQQPQGNGTPCPTDMEASRECNTQACPTPPPSTPIPTPSASPTSSLILFPNANNEYNIRRNVTFRSNGKTYPFYLGRKCEKSSVNLVKDTFGSPVEGTSEYLPNNDIAVFDANFKGIKLNSTNEQPMGKMGDKFSFHHQGDNKYKIKNTVINKWIKNSPNRISYIVGVSIKFYKPSINYVDNEADANVYAITLDGTNYKINFGHGDEKEVYFIENADTSVEYDRGYYTCNKKYDPPSTPSTPIPTPSTTEPILPPVPEFNNSVPGHIVEGYPVVHRTSATSMDVYVAFSRVARLYWLCLPRLPEREISLADIVVEAHKITDRLGLGTIANVFPRNYGISFDNIVAGTEYRIYFVAMDNYGGWSDTFEFDI